MGIYCLNCKTTNKPVITISDVSTYGIINEGNILSIITNLLDENGHLTLEEMTREKNKRYLNICKVVNTLCYKVSSSPISIHEFNPTLKLESSQNSFWSVNETEYKIDTSPAEWFSFNTFYAIFQNNTFDYFQTSKSECTNSFERYLELESNSKKGYLVLLGKKGWPKKPAIKFKKEQEGEILTRRVKILELNKENLIKSIEEITKESYEKVEINRFPSFYKKKERVVCIDKVKGYVYGLSYSEAKTLTKKPYYFNQIEVEFWSKLIDENDSSTIDWNDVVQSHKQLVKAIENKLVDENFEYKSPGGKKYDWLSKTIQSKRKLKLEQII